MADTQRSLADLQALFADNTTGNISPQDLRDFLLTMVSEHGGYAITAEAPTPIATPGTYVKAAGTTTIRPDTEGFDMPANNRLRYIGTIEKHVFIVATITFTTDSGTNQIPAFRFAFNGVTDAQTTMKNDIKASGDFKVVTVLWDGHMNANDYAEIFLTNTISTAAVRITNMLVHGRAVFS